MTAALWTAAVLLPLLLVVALVGARGAGRDGAAYRSMVRLAPLATAPALGLTLLPPDVDRAVARLEVPWLLLGTSVGLDPVGRALTVVSVVLYAAALAAVSRTHTRRAGGLQAFLLVSFVGNLGVYAATDTVTFYLAFAVMSFSAVGLVLHERTAAARRAGRVYLVLTVLSETAVLGALVLTAAAGGMRLADAPAAVAGSGSTDVIVALLLVGFGVKAGLVPLHVWLPLAHPAAPPPASAVLSGAMVKAGMVGWIRFLPLGEVDLAAWGRVLVVLALLGAFGAVVLGMGQRDPKVVLAYSTVSQMGYISAVLGVALAQPALAPAAVVAAAVYAVHHGLAKGALFLGVPVWREHGAGPARWLVVAGLVVAGLAVVGAPFTSGSLGKYATKTAVEGVALGGLDLVAVLPLVATGSTVLLVRCAYLLHRGDMDDRPLRSDPQLPAWVVLVVTSVALPWWVTARWLPSSAVPGLDPVTLWDATWPVLLGLAGGAAVWWRTGTGRPDPLRGRAQQVPAGDLLVLEERAAGRVLRAVRRAVGPLGRGRDRGVGLVRDGGRQLGLRLEGPVGAAARALGSYRGSGVVLLTLLVLAVLVQEVLA